MVFIDLHLHSVEDIKSKEEYFETLNANINYVFNLPSYIKPIFIQHVGFEEDISYKNTHFIFRKLLNNKYHTFFKLFFELKKLKPNVVLMHGMHKPWYIIIARFIFGKKIKLIVQNHAERPLYGWRLALQKKAVKSMDAILFVSKEQSKEWHIAGISEQKVFEMMEGSTEFKIDDKSKAKKGLNKEGRILFLWVGRLDDNKDPITMLRAFATYSKNNKNVSLIMIYGSNDIEEEVKDFIHQHSLEHSVELKGEIQKRELENYYNAADYFILASHREGSGYALCEAMACGCVPIITNIPSFSKMTHNGYCAYLFDPGNSDELYNILSNLNSEELEQMRERVIEQFEKELSFNAIANTLSMVVTTLSKK